MTYRCIALDVLTTNRGNVLCPYHQEMDKKKAPQDSKFMITGVPLPRMAAETKKEAKTSEFRECLDSGFLHCGCQTDAALWDFYFWKTLMVTEKIDGKDVTERVPRWTPRDRAFILKMFQEYTFLNIDDLYSRSMSPEWHESNACWPVSMNYVRNEAWEHRCCNWWTRLMSQMLKFPMMIMVALTDDINLVMHLLSSFE